MNILLWIIQIVLAALFVSGGAYKASKSDQLVKQTQALSAGAWKAVGIIEVIGGLLLLVPAGWSASAATVAAGLLAIEALLLAMVYARRSLKLTAANPLVYAVVMAVLAGVVVVGRYTLGRVA